MATCESFYLLSEFTLKDAVCEILPLDVSTMNTAVN